MDGEIALFLLSLDSQPEALIPSQIQNFSKAQNLSVELLESLRAQMRRERAVQQNSERLALGLKYRKLMPSALGNLHQRSAKKTNKLQAQTADSAESSSPEATPLQMSQDHLDNIFLDDTEIQIVSEKKGQAKSTSSVIKDEPGECKSESGIKQLISKSNLKKIKNAKKGSKSDLLPDDDFDMEFLSSHCEDLLGDKIPVIQRHHLHSSIKIEEQPLVPSDFSFQQCSQYVLYRGQQEDTFPLKASIEGIGSENERFDFESPAFFTHERVKLFKVRYLSQVVLDRDQMLGQFNQTLIIQQLLAETESPSIPLNEASAARLGQLSLQFLSPVAHKIERLFTMQALLQANRENLVLIYLQNYGLQAIYDWLHMLVAEKLVKGKSLIPVERQLLAKSLAVLGHAPISLEMLRQIKVGKLVNLIRAQVLCPKEIRAKASILVLQWKQLVSEFRESLSRGGASATSISEEQHSFVGKKGNKGTSCGKTTTKIEEQDSPIPQKSSKKKRVTFSDVSTISPEEFRIMIPTMRLDLEEYEEKASVQKRENISEDAEGELTVEFCSQTDIGDNPHDQNLQIDDNIARPQNEMDLELISEKMRPQVLQKQRTFGILQKLHDILVNDMSSIVENRDIFTQILSGFDKETLVEIFSEPADSVNSQAESEQFVYEGSKPVPPIKSKLISSVQSLIYEMITKHYITSNPILGLNNNTDNSSPSQINPDEDEAKEKENFKDIVDKEKFYKQAKEFFFTQPLNTMTEQKTESKTEPMPPPVCSPQQQDPSMGGQPIVAFAQTQAMMLGGTTSYVSSTGNSGSGSNIPRNYKTIACRHFHGAQNCIRGDTCHFIHEQAYKGREIPWEVLMKLRQENLQKYHNLTASSLMPHRQPQTPQQQQQPIHNGYPPQQPQMPGPYSYPQNGAPMQQPQPQQQQQQQQFMMPMAPPPYTHKDMEEPKQDYSMIGQGFPPPPTETIVKTQPSPVKENCIETQEIMMAGVDQSNKTAQFCAPNFNQMPFLETEIKQQKSPPPTPPMSTEKSKMLEMPAQGQGDSTTEYDFNQQQMQDQQYNFSQQQALAGGLPQHYLSHPYFNPAFTAQYYAAQEAYKHQQQAQLVANLTQGEIIQPMQAGKGIAGFSNLGLCAGQGTSSTAQAAGLGLGVAGTPFDYQQKMLLEQKTQDTHRKLLEQIKQEKERKKMRYLQKVGVGAPTVSVSQQEIAAYANLLPQNRTIGSAESSNGVGSGSQPMCSQEMVMPQGGLLPGNSPSNLTSFLDFGQARSLEKESNDGENTTDTKPPLKTEKPTSPSQQHDDHFNLDQGLGVLKQKRPPQQLNENLQTDQRSQDLRPPPRDFQRNQSDQRRRNDDRGDRDRDRDSSFNRQKFNQNGQQNSSRRGRDYHHSKMEVPFDERHEYEREHFSSHSDSVSPNQHYNRRKTQDRNSRDFNRNYQSDSRNGQSRQYSNSSSKYKSQASSNSYRQSRQRSRSPQRYSGKNQGNRSKNWQESSRYPRKH